MTTTRTQRRGIGVHDTPDPSRYLRAVAPMHVTTIVNARCLLGQRR
jgi:hypothetical protein